MIIIIIIIIAYPRWKQLKAYSDEWLVRSA